MRVVESRIGMVASGAGVLTVRDSFARFRAGSVADPAIGGFRILHARPSGRAVANRPSRRRFSAARMPATGFLSVMFIGGLALAVLAGPANCPCGTPEPARLAKTDAGARLIARLAYSKDSMADLGERVRARASGLAATPAGGTALPKLLTVAALESDVRFSDSVRSYSAAPISTAALPAVETPKSRPFTAPQRLGLLPAEFENLADTMPRSIRIAAATPADGMRVPVLPAVAPKTIAVETQRDPETEAKPHRERVTAKRTYAKKREHKPADSSRSARRAAARRAPRWSQQLHANPWQTKAFSYLR